MAGIPPSTMPTSANGSRNVNRPQTLMYSSRECPSPFITALRRPWTCAAATASALHTGGSGSSAEHGRDLLDAVVRAERLRDHERHAVPREPVGVELVAPSGD